MSLQEAKIIMPKKNANGDLCAGLHDDLTRILMDKFKTVIRAPITMVAVDPQHRMVYEAGELYSVYSETGGGQEKEFSEIIKSFVSRLNVPFLLAANFGGSLSIVEA